MTRKRRICPNCRAPLDRIKLSTKGWLYGCTPCNLWMPSGETASEGSAP